jgi:ketosteroid isomerase-like protein
VTGEPEPSRDTPGLDRRRKQLERALEAFNRHEFDLPASLFAEDVVWRPYLSRTETPILRGRQAVRESWESQVDLLDLRASLREVREAADGRLVAWVELSAVGRASEMALSGGVAFLMSVGSDGLVHSVETFGSLEEALAQSGEN